MALLVQGHRLMNREDEVGITINLRSIYEQLQKQNESLQEMKVTNREQAAELKSIKENNLTMRNEIKEENAVLRGEVEKLRNRFNGVLVGLGTGMIVGLPTLFAVLR
jgi:hypothetical protein